MIVILAALRVNLPIMVILVILVFGCFIRELSWGSILLNMLLI
jgi:hypothetical protein